MNTRRGQDWTRRQVLRGVAAAAGGFAAAPYVITSTALGGKGRPPASERTVMGYVGTGGRGFGSHVRGFTVYGQVQSVAVCDVDRGRMERARQWVNATYANQDCAAYDDFRELLARRDVDAVAVGTPDHWHALVSLAAARAGKDIYCEKPLARTIREGKAVVHAVRRFGRVLQTGSQERSNRNCRFACELVHNRRIGTLRAMEVNLPVAHRACPNYPPAAVPLGFDYDRWLGPAPWEPFTPRRCHGSFRFIRDYAAGELTDRGAHVLDLAHWVAGFDTTGPVEIEGSGWYPPDGLFNTFMRFRFEMKYANGVRLTCRSTGSRGVKFIGDRGWVFIGIHGGHLSADPPSLLRETIGKDEIHLHESIGGHKQDFLTAVRTRGDVVAPAHAGHRTNSACALGEIAMLLGRKLRWDPVAERFLNDESANALIARPMRPPWRL